MCTAAKMIRMGICMIDQAFKFYEVNTAHHSRGIKTVSSPSQGSHDSIKVCASR